MHLPTMKKTSSFPEEIIASKKDIQNILLVQTMIDTKLLKGNRLLDITPEAVVRGCNVRKMFLQIS